VNPKNWKTVSASTKKPWYITYRYYDPSRKDEYPNGMPVMVKGMNHYTDLRQRQAFTRQTLQEIKELLEDELYNPLAQEVTTAPAAKADYIIHPTTPLKDALQAAKDRLQRAKSTLDDIQVTIRGFLRAAQVLSLDRKPVSEIKRRTVIAILDKCAVLNEKWSPAWFNKYKANLSMVWTELRG
jgi:hypothetical protein